MIRAGINTRHQVGCEKVQVQQGHLPKNVTSNAVLGSWAERPGRSGGGMYTTSL